MNLSKMSERELQEYENYCRQQENLQAVAEVSDFKKFYGKKVIVKKGRKVPLGTCGEVVYLARRNYGKDPWTGWTTRVGIKDNRGTVHYTDVNNIELA